METNEIMNTEEVMNEVAETSSGNSNSGLKIAVGIGLGALVSGLAYKFAIKPIMTKIRAKKAEEALVINDCENTEADESEE